MFNFNATWFEFYHFQSAYCLIIYSYYCLLFSSIALQNFHSYYFIIHSWIQIIKAMLMVLIFLDSLNKYSLKSVQQIWQYDMTFGHLSVALYAEELSIKSGSIFFFVKKIILWLIINLAENDFKVNHFYLFNQHIFLRLSNQFLLLKYSLLCWLILKLCPLARFCHHFSDNAYLFLVKSLFLDPTTFYLLMNTFFLQSSLTSMSTYFLLTSVYIIQHGFY